MSKPPVRRCTRGPAWLQMQSLDRLAMGPAVWRVRANKPYQVLPFTHLVSRYSVQGPSLQEFSGFKLHP